MRKTSAWFFALGLFVVASPAAARPVVVELFTSEACSSCPPAEALLRQLQASDPDILPLSFHVTYWDGPAWTDRYSLKAATDRQSWYARIAHTDQVYTPEAVVDGTQQMVGSDRASVTAAIDDAKREMAAPVPVTLRVGVMARVIIGTAPEQAPATAWLVGYDPEHTTPIGGGENGGATIIEVNVVRSIDALGVWHGAPLAFTVARPAGMRLAVVLQRPDGGIAGAATD